MDSLSYKTISANAATVDKQWVVIDATDEVWALGSGLTISDMIHPTAEGAVKLGQILGRHIKQALQEG